MRETRTGDEMTDCRDIDRCSKAAGRERRRRASSRCEYGRIGCKRCTRRVDDAVDSFDMPSIGFIDAVDGWPMRWTVEKLSQKNELSRACHPRALHINIARGRSPIYFSSQEARPIGTRTDSSG